MEKYELKNKAMKLSHSFVVEGAINVPKDEIEEWIGIYEKEGNAHMEHGCPTWQTWFYWGKRDVLIDLLNNFNKQ